MYLIYILHDFFVPVSPDALLLQSSTVADSIPFEFSDGIKESVPCSYIEFAERIVLPEYKDLPEDKVSILKFVCLFCICICIF